MRKRLLAILVLGMTGLGLSMSAADAWFRKPWSALSWWLFLAAVALYAIVVILLRSLLDHPGTIAWAREIRARQHGRPR
jgi:hypothetical protein